MSKVVELNLNPDVRILKQFGWIALVGFGALAALAWTESLLFSFGLGDSRQAVTTSLALCGGVSLIFSLVFPKANRPLFVVLSLISFPIGFVLSYVIMGFLYFGLFAPLAIVFRVVGRDSLARAYDEGAESYWTPVPATKDKKRYFRQF